MVRKRHQQNMPRQAMHLKLGYVFGQKKILRREFLRAFLNSSIRNNLFFNNIAFRPIGILFLFDVYIVAIFSVLYKTANFTGCEKQRRISRRLPTYGF